jgi:NAD(P)H dehydrogenase (quinone)
LIKKKEAMMPKVLIIYYSASGNTKKMAELITEGVRSEGAEAVLKDVKDASPQDFVEPEGIIIGSPTYYGTMASELKSLLDQSVEMHGQLDGKLGAAFSSAANIAGGNETTVMSILNAMMIHGFVVQGDPMGSHYGPVAIGPPDKRAEKECKRLAKRFVSLLNKIG